MIAFRCLCLLLVLCLAGCKPEPTASNQPLNVFVQVGSDSYLSLQLPVGWREVSAANVRAFVHPKVGRMEIRDRGPYQGTKLPSINTLIRVQDHFQRHGYALRGQEEIPIQGQSALLVTYGTSADIAQALYFVYQDHLVGLEVHASPRARSTVPALLTSVASSLTLNVPRPELSLLSGPTPTPQAAVQPMPERRQRRHTERSPAWGSWMPAILFLLFTSLPAYLGARGGYSSAQASGANVRTGAASGAFTATFFAIVTCGLIFIALIWAFTLQAPGGGGGIMSLGTASVIATVFIVFAGLAAAAVGASLAALGAYLGAGASGFAAGALAAFFALGVVATPFILKGLPTSTRHRHSQAPGSFSRSLAFWEPSLPNPGGFRGKETNSPACRRRLVMQY